MIKVRIWPISVVADVHSLFPALSARLGRRGVFGVFSVPLVLLYAWEALPA